MDPIIISAAPNGARKTKQHHPAIPLSTEEIVAETARLVEAGITLLHLHIRDDEGGHTLDSGRYKETIAAIRTEIGDSAIIQVTSEAVGIYKPEEQLQMVREVEPESVSLAIREIIPDPSYEEEAGKFLAWAKEVGIVPQFILYSPEEVRYFADLRKRGIVPQENVFVLFVLGRKTAETEDATGFADPEDLDPFLECFGDGVIKLADTIWTVSAFGGNENACMLKSISCGGHVRIGFENNHLMADGSPAENNAALITQFVENAREASTRPIADVSAARNLLGID